MLSSVEVYQLFYDLPSNSCIVLMSENIGG